MSTSEPVSRPEHAWQVGTLAQATGLTVRALHHYDHIGLLSPSRRTAAGHRLYTADDVARLYRIRLLRNPDPTPTRQDPASARKRRGPEK